MFSGWEGIVVIVIAVALFGSRLPKIARNLGQAQQEFKKGVSDSKPATPAVEKPESNKPDTPST
ncbi:MAG: twin-arginine translocase TatA/TatE family subunit [Ilumatobacteraceae bacterium]